MADTSRKLAVKKRLVNLLDQLNGVAVEYAPEVTPSAAKVVSLGDARSKSDPAGFRAGRKRRNESWDQDVWLFVRDEATAEDADDAAQAIANEIEDLVWDNPDLEVAGLSSCVVAEVDAYMPGPTKTGWSVRWRVQLTCMAQIS